MAGPQPGRSALLIADSSLPGKYAFHRNFRYLFHRCAAELGVSLFLCIYFNSSFNLISFVVLVALRDSIMQTGVLSTAHIIMCACYLILLVILESFRVILQHC